jgi:ubiquitin carboxyl-terminal hydrolase 9/24
MEPEPSLQTYAVPLFNQVRDGWRQNRSVEMDPVVGAFECALTFVNTDEAQEFLAECFHEILSVLLNTHPSKMTQHNKEAVTKSLILAVDIIVRLFEIGLRRADPQASTSGKDSDHRQYVTTLCALFSKKRAFYKELPGSFWDKQPGAPEVRAQLHGLFCEKEGFNVLAELISAVTTSTHDKHSAQNQPEDDSGLSAENWLNADICQKLLVSALQVDGLQPDVMAKLAVAVLQHLCSLPENDLKKENTDLITGVALQARRIILLGVPGCSRVFASWMQLVLKYVRSTSLPQRLFGWEHIGHLIETTNLARPPPSRYEVIGAGSTEVNGVYVLCEEAGEDLEYKKYGGPDADLTISLCPMRNGSKWWFVSEPDAKEPGTDKDVDYYRHDSVRSEDERFPPCSGWKTAGAAGLEPIPTLNQIYDEKEDDVFTEEKLETLLLKWVQQNTIIEDEFGDSRIHREVVTRNAPLVHFLTRMDDGLQEFHLECIWKASMGGKQEAVVTEIHRLLIAIIPSIHENLQCYLLDALRTSLSLEDNFNGVVSFIEHSSQTSASSVVFSGSDDVNDALLQLLWIIQQKSSRPDVVRLFGEALSSPASAARRRSFLFETLAVIRSSACPQPPDPVPPPQKVHRALELVEQLIDSADSEQVVVELARDHNFLQLLLDEFVVCRNAISAHDLSDAELSSLQHRLSVIRFVHGKAAALSISTEHVDLVWRTLQTVSEREICLDFLEKAISTDSKRQLTPTIDLSVAHYIFHELICNQTDFSTLNDQGYNVITHIFVACPAPY